MKKDENIKSPSKEGLKQISSIGKGMKDGMERDPFPVLTDEQIEKMNKEISDCAVVYEKRGD